MDVAFLREVLERPDVHKRILGAYRGAYSLGITRSTEDESEYAILLRVQDKKPRGFAREITFEGLTIPVIIRGDFRPPRALKRKYVRRKKLGTDIQRREVA